MSDEQRPYLGPARARDWDQVARTDAMVAMDVVAQTVMAEAKKNPVERQPAFLAAPAMNTYLFGQTTHDVGREVMDALIKAGWVPPSRISVLEERIRKVRERCGQTSSSLRETAWELAQELMPLLEGEDEDLLEPHVEPVNPADLASIAAMGGYFANPPLHVELEEDEDEHDRP